MLCFNYKMDAVLILKMGAGNVAFRVCQRDKTHAHTHIHRERERERERDKEIGRVIQPQSQIKTS